MNHLVQLGKNQKGVVAVIVAIVMSILIGFSAIVVDVGYLYEVRRQLQSAADAAALAGARDLAAGEDDVTIQGVAQDYATRNDFGVDIDTPEALWVENTVINRDPSPQYVQVTVEKKVNMFFAGIFGQDNSEANVKAQARAQVVYLTGSKGLVPWGLILIDPDSAKAQLEGNPEVVLGSVGNNTYSGAISAPSAARNSGYSVKVTVYNQQGFPETVYPAAYVTVVNPTDPIKNIYFSNGNVNFLKATQDTTLYVESTGGVPKVRFNGKNSDMQLQSGTLYKLKLTAPSITNAAEYFPIDITVGQGAGAFSLTNAAVIVVRRTTYPIKSVVLSKTCFQAGSGESFNVAAIVSDYEFGELYDLKVVQGGECGNFNALDFRYVWHQLADGTWVNIGEHDSASDYYNSISGYYEGSIYLGDIISTQTGSLSAPQTAKALATRFAGHETHVWDPLWTYDNYGIEEGCGRIVMIPIVEKIDRLNGKSEVKVVRMAAFFIENIPDQGLNITGRFIEYVTPGQSSDDPPDGLYMKTVRLVPPDF